MLTAVQREKVLEIASRSEMDPPAETDDDIWYGFLSSLFAAGMTLKDLKLQPNQQPEIMACLRRAPSTGPRAFNKRGERPARSASSSTTRATRPRH